MANAFFITGTDTDVGKTFVAEQLLHALTATGFRSIGFKPVAAGAHRTNEGLRNSDALALQGASSHNPDYDVINPVCLGPAIAPHIAAEEARISLNLAQLNTWWRERPREYDIEIVEGAGGWLLPLNSNETLADFVIAQQMPVILVVGMTLGCLNHAMLTLAAIQQAGVPLAGWIANQPGHMMDYYEQNLHYLKQRIPAPLLAEIPCQDPHSTVVAPVAFELEPLLGGLTPGR